MLPGNTPSRAVGNELAKALLIDTTTGDGHSVMYNPEELKLDQGNTFAEVGIPGLDAPPLQYVRGKSRVLTMELFFDTYEIPADVREHTEPIVRLLDKRRQTHAPSVLLFLFGRMQFRCVLVEASQRFTLFFRDGTPVRSTMTVRLQEYVEAQIEIKQGVFFGSPTVSAVVGAAVSGRSTVHMTVAGDTLSGLAAAYLGDAGRWRQIAEANRIEDPAHLPPGRSLVIPGGGS
ncbi:LysM peptidoglycan-binding domain-containing protein [Amycolatopsis sp. cg5]|uniref:CIS tube protein n=1 Tax=Amycolatopsis sp. cg5 TaxID=3238802 RepID=UPI0035238A2E